MLAKGNKMDDVIAVQARLWEMAQMVLQKERICSETSKSLITEHIPYIG